MNVLTQDDWNALFPTKLYQSGDSKEDGETVNNCLVAFMIAHGASDDAVMQSVKKDRKVRLLSFTGYNLSLLHLAIMKGREALAKMLIDEGAPLTCKDKFGWHPVHHAAICCEAIYRAILEKDSDSKKTTALGATCEDLRVLVGIDDVTNSLASLRIEEQAGKEPVAFSPTQHLELFGMSKYRDENYFSPNCLKELWTQELPVQYMQSMVFPERHNFEKNIERITKLAFEEALKCPPKVVLKQGIDGVKEGEWALFADEDLPYGYPLFPCTGQYAGINEFRYGKIEILPYQFLEYDAQEVGNCSRFVNDGFPNCAFMIVNHYKGLTCRMFMVVSKEGGIKKGEQLVCDYGVVLRFNQRWNMPYTVLHAEEMRTFIKNLDMNQVKIEQANRYKEFVNAQYSDNKVAHRLSLLLNGSSLRYCFECVPAIVDLWCNKIITAKGWLKERDACYSSDDDYEEVLPKNSLSFLKNLSALEGAPRFSDLDTKIRSFIGNAMSRRTASAVDTIVVSIRGWLDSPVDTSWEEFSKEL